MMCIVLQYSDINSEHIDMLRLLYTDILLRHRLCPLQVIAQMSRKAVDALAERFALRFGLSSDVLFPAMHALRSMLPSAL